MSWQSRFSGEQLQILTPAFWEGREFRTFKELNIANGATYVIKVVVPVDTVFYGLELAIDDGRLRVGTYAGGTSGGVFGETLPRFNANNMTPGENLKNTYPPGTAPYAPQVLLTAGGTHTGGTELDVQRLRVANSAGMAASIANGTNLLGSERGVAPATYHFRLLALSGPVTGVFRARWEERPVTP
jgi:hypothetical protein